MFCCRKTQCLATSSHIVLRSTGPKLWKVTNDECINLLVMRRAPRRPKKLRNESNDEPINHRVLPRQFKTVKCMKCNKFGHNSKTFKGKNAAGRKISKGGNKLKKTKEKVANFRLKMAKEGTSGPFVQSTSPSGPFVYGVGPNGPHVNDAGPFVKVFGVRQKRMKQKTKAREVEVVVSQGSQAP